MCKDMDCDLEEEKDFLMPLPASPYVQITLKRNASSATAERLFHF